MDIVLNSYGASMSKKSGLFVFKNNNEETAISPEKINSIFILKGTKITSDAILLAINKEIDIIFGSKSGMPEGRIWSYKFGSISTIRKSQLKFIGTKESSNWIKNLLINKIENQISILITYEKEIYKGEVKNFKSELNFLANIKNRIQDTPNKNLEEISSTLRGFEGNASKKYFKSLNRFLPEKYSFLKRSSRPALDIFNALINYGYGILYSKIEASLIRAGLDPYIGVFHRDEYNRPVLVFDVIEKYRVWVDFVVIELCLQDAFIHECFSKKAN
jgi:CRISPR-associated protein Cas1